MWTFKYNLIVYKIIFIPPAWTLMHYGYRQKHFELISQELDGISEWTSISNLKGNLAECCKMVVCLPSADWLEVFPVPMGFTTAEVTTAVGVTFKITNAFVPHVIEMVSNTGASLYSLKMFKAHHLRGQTLFDIMRWCYWLGCFASPQWSRFKSDKRSMLWQYQIRQLTMVCLPGNFRMIDELFNHQTALYSKLF